jgi:hypothetical protein
MNFNLMTVKQEVRSSVVPGVRLESETQQAAEKVIGSIWVNDFSV